MVFADFRDVGRPRGGPLEVPLPADRSLAREWAVVCEGDSLAACLAGRERLEAASSAGGRGFETVWSVEPAVVRHALVACIEHVAGVDPAAAERATRRTRSVPAAADAAALRAAAALTGRMARDLDARRR